MVAHYRARARDAWLEAAAFHRHGYWLQWHNAVLRRKANEAEAFVAYSQSQVLDLGTELQSQKEVIHWQLGANAAALKATQQRQEADRLFETAAAARHAATRAETASQRAEVARLALDRFDDAETKERVELALGPPS